MQQKACLEKAASEGRTEQKKRSEVLKGQGQKLERVVFGKIVNKVQCIDTVHMQKV
jgi:hypothetical protein